jgi:DNA-directed RNA polymerase subunit RPC12/RpoP
MNHFICANCNKKVSLSAPGTKNRNHCPFCLYSLHVDIIPGDRKNPCMGLMKPVALTTKHDGEEVLTHKCQKCGFERWNRVAGDDVDFNI